MYRGEHSGNHLENRSAYQQGTHRKRLIETWWKKREPLENRRRSVEVVPAHIHIRAANRWRDQYNPTRGLTIERAADLLEAGERGEYADLQWLYRFVEKRDTTLAALLARYDGGLLKLDWTIKEPHVSQVTDHASRFTFHAPSASPQEEPDPMLAREQAAMLHQAYSRLDNLREALKFLVLARFRGFAHLEKWFDDDGRVTHLEPVPQWLWVRDGVQGAWEYNRQARAGVRNGEPIDPARFLIREADRPVDEMAIFPPVRRAPCQKAWDGFVETSGIPAIFVVGPAGASEETQADLTEKVEGITSSYRGYLPAGSHLESVSADTRGINPFHTYLKALDEALVLAATGGKLSILSEPGVGLQAGQVHWRAWREVMQAEALLISEVFQRQFDAPLLAHHFPGKPPLAYFELCANEETDVGTVVEHAAKLSAAGYIMDPAHLSEKTGYRLAKPTDPTTRTP